MSTRKMMSRLFMQALLVNLYSRPGNYSSIKKKLPPGAREFHVAWRGLLLLF
jgi:hypothetical protein